MNSANLIGRLTADPELRKTESGKSVTKFTIAVPRKFNKEQTDFIDCIAWEKTAELIEKWFRKGILIAVSGEIQTGTYEDRNGNKRKTFTVNVTDVTFCEKSEKTQQTSTQTATPTMPADDGFEGVDDDDLPF